jgi:hypothetical protein
VNTMLVTRIGISQATVTIHSHLASSRTWDELREAHLTVGSWPQFSFHAGTVSPSDGPNGRWRLQEPAPLLERP